MIRTDKEGQNDNHIYHWETGDKEATDAAFAAGRQGRLARHVLPALPPGAARDVRLHRRHRPGDGTGDDLHDVAGARTRSARSSRWSPASPRRRSAIISPDIGGGFGNKVPVYPGYVVATAASLLLGHPVKWIEDRSENLISTGFARDYHMHGELALKNDGTMLGLRASLLADEGAFYADAQPSKFKVGSVPHRERVLRPAGDPRVGRGRVHEQGARRRRLPVLVPRDRGLVPDRATGAERRLRAGDGSGRAPQEELHPRRTSSRTRPRRDSSTTPATTKAPWTRRSR